MLDDIKDKIIDACIAKKLRAYKVENEYSMADGFHTYDATLIFADEYVKAYRHFYSKLWDEKVGKYHRGYAGKLFAKKSSATTGFYKARAKADELNMPYAYYVWRAFEFYIKRNYQRLPRSVFLYNEVLVADLVADWPLAKDFIFYKKRRF